MRAASRSGSTATREETPPRIEWSVPDLHSGLGTMRSARPATAARMRSASAPTTTTIGAAPERVTASAARATSGKPPISRSCFADPIRDEPPAARTTAPNRKGAGPAGSGMDGKGAVAQRAPVAAGEHGAHLRGYAQGHLLGRVGPEVEADGCTQERAHGRRDGHARLGEVGKQPF